MNKKEYMESLEELVLNSDISNKYDILAECEQEINKFIGLGMSMDAIYNEIGSPKDVFEDVKLKHSNDSKKDLKEDKKKSKKEDKKETKQEDKKESNEEDSLGDTITEKYDEIINSETMQNVKDIANKGKNEIVSVFNKIVKTDEDSNDEIKKDNDNNRILILIILALLFLTLANNSFIAILPIAIFDVIFRLVVIGAIIACVVYLLGSNKKK